MPLRPRGGSSAVVCLVACAGLSACSSDPGHGPPAGPTGATTNDAPSLPTFVGASGDAELVFEAIDTFDAQGSMVASRQQGTLTLADWQRAARPWTHRSEAFVYHEQAWDRALDDGTSERGYRVVRTENLADPTPPTVDGPPALDPWLAKAASGDEPVPVTIQLRGYPDWDVPLVPTSRFLSDADRALGLEQRKAALEARQAFFAQRVAPVLEDLQRNGAEITGLGWGGGWILATVPPDALAVLSGRMDLARIDTAYGEAEEANAQSGFAEDGAQPTPGAWYIGEGRMAQRADLDRFFTAGHTGEIPNASRHAYGDVVVGINELRIPEDEGCYLADGSGCTSFSRVKAKFTCNGATPGARCSTTTDYPDTDEPNALVCCTASSECAAINPAWSCVPTAAPGCAGNTICQCTGETCARHPTNVASIILGDYSGGQADGLAVGDDACPGGCTHSQLFKNRATGLAPEAGVVFWGRHASCAGSTNDCPTAPCSTNPCQEDSLANAFTQPSVGASRLHVDIMNNSWVWNEATPTCNPLAIRAFEIEAENAYDDGVLVVAAAGNDGSTTNCDVRAPGVIPKVLAVNGMGTGAAGTCGTNYQSCVLAPGASRTGGATVNTPDGQARVGALSVIGLVAPTAFRFTTQEYGEYGEVNDSQTFPAFGGSSGASAFVSGAAAAVKSHYLARGATWINQPGRLQTVMLTMTDRHYDASTTQRITGSDNRWGLGRIKLRRFGDAGAADAAGVSFNATTVATSTAPVHQVPFGTPLSADAALVKCVLLQEEDMSGKTVPTVSDVNLTVEIQTPGGASCSGSDPVAFSRSDTSYDIKSMVAVTSADAALGGKCVKVVATPAQIAGTSATFHIMCYASSVPDDGRLPDTDNDGLADADEATYGACVSAAQAGCSGNCATADSTLAVSTDSDCDGVTDPDELTSLSEPTKADTDGDGTRDKLDLVTFDQCTTRGLRIPNVRGPLSTVTPTQRRPAASWESEPAATGARIQFSSSASFASVLQSYNVTGTGVTPTADFPQGMLFTRAFATSGSDLDCKPAPWRSYVGGVGLAPGNLATCAIVETGIKCWGYNGWGTLGIGGPPPYNSYTPVNVVGIGGGTRAVALNKGGDHGCALTSAGGVKCWGSAGYGSLGDGTTLDRPTPVDVSGLTSGAIAVSAGISHSCAVTSAGAAKCWGSNDFGQLGTKSSKNSLVPADVVGLSSGVVALSSGHLHTCALLSSGGVKCWGSNAFGQVGDNSTVDRSNAVQVVGLTSGVASIDLAGGQSCAITTAGAMKCWGRNEYGMLGDGTTSHRSTPVVPIGMGSGVLATAVGFWHTCALTTSGMKCWGANNYGQLGNGVFTSMDYLEPVAVQGLPAGVSAVGAGGDTTCALIGSGGLLCWGNNTQGQLGTNDTVSRNVPTPVLGL